MTVSPKTNQLKNHLDQAVAVTRSFLSPGLSTKLDDATIASRYPGIIGALVVAAAIEDLRREVAE